MPSVGTAGLASKMWMTAIPSLRSAVMVRSPAALPLDRVQRVVDELHADLKQLIGISQNARQIRLQNWCALRC